jgi:hypothetical protein
VVIGAEIGRDDHGSIPRNCDREGAGTTWCQNWPPNQIKLVVKAKKKKKKGQTQHIVLLKRNLLSILKGQIQSIDQLKC